MASSAYEPLGVHLVGSVPLPDAATVFRTVAEGLRTRVRRIPDGETGPRADWIVWQYPVLSALPQFEVAPPAPEFYRALPRLRLRDGESGADVRFERLGYADAAVASYDTFVVLKRDGVVPRGCRFQISLPTPLAPISAFVALDDQELVERAYEAALADEVQTILQSIPHDQLAIQWDVNFEFGMLEGALPVWFADREGGVLARLLRVGALVPGDVELGFHFCHGHDEQDPRRSHRDLARMVGIANELAVQLERALNWVHVPLGADEADDDDAGALADLRLRAETELYLGVLRPDEEESRTRRRIDAAHNLVGEFGLATPCGWGRLPQTSVAEVLDAHARLSRPFADATAESSYAFAWPESFARIPDEEWVEAPVEAFGLDYDTVENHGWYRNLDLTVEQLARDLAPGDVLIDYSGGTGILLDRLRLRIFDRPVGMIIVDSSPKFLRVALGKFRHDMRVAFRRLHFLRDEQRLQFVHEVLDERFADGGASVIASTNAIHLYEDLTSTLRSWVRVLQPQGRVRINSGNIRNPRADESEWIIDETVYVVHEVAAGLVRTDERWAAYRDVVDDADRLAPYLEYRDRVFLAPRPLDVYVRALEAAGFDVDEVTERTIEADVDEWYEFLAAYADAVLGWVGGTAKVDGRPATEAAATERRALLREALVLIFGGRPTFRCCWTYITATRR